MILEECKCGHFKHQHNNLEENGETDCRLCRCREYSYSKTVDYSKYQKFKGK